jgi:hypothetical protein
MMELYLCVFFTKFKVGKGQVIQVSPFVKFGINTLFAGQGWDEGILSMHVGTLLLSFHRAAFLSAGFDLC